MNVVTNINERHCINIFFNTMPPWKIDCHVFVLYIINLLWPVIVACLSSHSSTI